MGGLEGRRVRAGREHRPLGQPVGGRVVGPGPARPGVVEARRVVPQAGPPGADEHHITLPHGDALHHRHLGQLRAGDGCGRLQVGDAAVAGHVEQHATAQHWTDLGDVLGRQPGHRLQLIGRAAAVHQPIAREVAQGVDVGGDVGGGHDLLVGEARPAGARRRVSVTVTAVHADRVRRVRPVHRHTGPQVVGQVIHHPAADHAAEQGEKVHPERYCHVRFLARPNVTPRTQPPDAAPVGPSATKRLLAWDGTIPLQCRTSRWSVRPAPRIAPGRNDRVRKARADAGTHG